MDVMKEHSVVPKLRFGGFKGDWNFSKLEDLFDFKNGLNKEKEYFGKGTPIINFMDVYKLISIRKKDITGLVELTNSELSRFSAYEGDVFFTRTSETIHDIGMSATLVEPIENCVFSGFVLRARPKTKSLSKYFTGYLFSTEPVRKEITTKSSMTTRALTSGTLLNKVYFHFPSLTEQQKIASFLSAVDEKLQQLTKKKELLEEYKTGVMQKIFSQELRFKDDNGNNYPDWEEKKLGDIGEFKTSSVDKLIKENEKMVSLINYMNVYNHQNITNEITKDLMQVSAKEKQIETSTLKRGDILFTPSSETPSDIGHSIVIFEDLYNTLYSYHLMRFRPIIKLDILYSHYFCNIPSVLRQITRFATGSTRFTISVGSFSKIIIQLPSFDEQQKIANFLSSLDSKIALVSTQIENTKAFKKGLLQQMFV